jgi:diguanylate cyclase (GGDEF)-like protein
MLKMRLLPVAALAAISLLPATAANAAAGTTPEDRTELIRSVATEGASLLAEEAELIGMTRQDLAASPVDTAATRAQLRLIDGQVNEIFLQLENLGVEITAAISTTMDRLPRFDGASPEELEQLSPLGVVYDAAIEDLLRIAATPGAVAPLGSTDDGSSFGLLAVAAMASLVLGGAAWSTTMRRTTDNDELTAMAWSDGLTGLANRRRLDRDLDARPGSPEPTAVIMVDLDHFKSINDRYGHQHGDSILRKIGTMLGLHLRADDVVYRYGGEEFCVLLPGATNADAEMAAERIVQAAREITLPDGSSVTVSVGVANGSTADVTSTLELADQAMYTAKERGRDRSIVADSLVDA